MIREIIRMKDKGLSHSQISKNLGKSRTTIVKYLTAFELSGIKNKELLELCSQDLHDLFEAQNAILPSDKDIIRRDFVGIPEADIRDIICNNAKKLLRIS